MSDSPLMARQRFIDEWAPRFPLRTLSQSSLLTYWKCPEKWRRRYIEQEPEPWSGRMLAGKAAWSAEARCFHRVVDHERLPSTEALLDWFSDGWTQMAAEDPPDWYSDSPGELKDKTAAAARLWHTLIAPTIRPLAVEREFRLRIEELPWELRGYIDLERLLPRRRSRCSIPVDYKMTSSRVSQEEADADVQASTYLCGRRAEGDPAPQFEFALALPQVTPKVDTVVTRRTDAELDEFLNRVLLVAAQIAHSVENDVWDGAIPGQWWCSERYCGFWTSCAFGGALRIDNGTTGTDDAPALDGPLRTAA